MAGANEYSMKICNLHLSRPHPLTPSPRRGEINGGILSSVGRANGYPYDEPTRVGPLRRVRAKLPLAILGAVCLLLTGCYSESYDAEEASTLNGTTQVVLTFVTPNSSSTRSATEDPDGYEAGVDYENDINISGHDYKIYFFSYEDGGTQGGTLIAEFTPTDVSTSSSSTATTYTIMGSVPSELLSVSDFRVVMLANWGMWYPSVTEGETTIDNLVEGANTTFNAFKKFVIDADNLIPFYGVQEYTGVTFAPNTTTTLSTPVSLLRAVAKVEVILTEDSEVNAFDDVSIVNYNSEGYCAPAGVYTASDYDTEMKNNPTNGNWGDEWIKDLHLVNSKNDTDSKSQAFTQISGASQDTWRIYLPEYDNSGNDYSYISLTVEDTPFELYFAEYIDGFTDNTDRYNIKRNNIYRFYVTYTGDGFRVRVEQWENVFDNEWTFGETAPQQVSSEFSVNGIMYNVLVSELEEWVEDNKAHYNLQVETTVGGTYGTEVVIPDTIRYHGFSYRVVAVGDGTFYEETGIESIYIPSSVLNIGSYAFYECSALTSLTIDSYSPPTCKDDTFNGLTTIGVTLYVPYQVIDQEYGAEPWISFKAVEAIPGREPENDNP